MLPCVYLSSLLLTCSHAPFLHGHAEYLLLVHSRVGYTPGPHLALQGQTAAKNHSPGFWHTQGIYQASTGAPVLLSVPWEQMKSGVGHPVCSRLGVSEAKVWCSGTVTSRCQAEGQW